MESDGESVSFKGTRSSRDASIVGGSSRGTLSHPLSKNKQWVAGARAQSVSPAPSNATALSDGHWERGGHRGGGRGRGRGSLAAMNGRASARITPDASPRLDDNADDFDVENGADLSIMGAASASARTNGREMTWEERKKVRAEETQSAIQEGKMDDPNAKKRLEDAITMVGTCQDMCPEFERYRRERENNLDRWEVIIGPDGKPTKRVDHARAVKMYERGQGDKIIPSDLRPAPVLKRTLDYLFHDLIPRGGFADTQAFVRDRSRAVRNDFTIQHDNGPIAIECHERCTRYHILSMHLLYDSTTFDRALEYQQCMNSLLSLKEFYDDQRGRYQSPNELEMRIYHRLGLIRDMGDRKDNPPPHIASDPAFQLVTRFRTDVQAASPELRKASKLVVSPQAMQTFAELAGVLRERGNIVMIYLVACFLEHLFGKDTLEDMESIVEGLSIQDIIDGNSRLGENAVEEVEEPLDAGSAMDDDMQAGNRQDDLDAFIEDVVDEEPLEQDGNAMEEEQTLPSPLKRGATQWLNDNFGEAPIPPKTTATLFAQPASQGAQGSPFGATSQPGVSVFSKLVSSSSAPALGSSQLKSAFATSASSPNVFGGPVFGVPKTQTAPFIATPAPVKPPIPSFSSASAHTSTPPSAAEQPKPKPFASLAEMPPLSSVGEPDKPASPFLKPDSPFRPPSSIAGSSILNPQAPSFSPSPIRLGTTSTLSQKPHLTPLRTESLTPLSSSTPNATKRGDGFPSVPSSTPSTLFPFPSQSNTPSDKAAPLSINTDPAIRSTGLLRKTTSIDSPVGPPPLNRQAPISLPGTPTVTSQPGPATPANFDSNKPLLFSSPAGAFPPIFSHPSVNISTPSSLFAATKESPLRNSFTADQGQSTPSSSKVTETQSSPPPKPPSPVVEVKSEAELEEEAITFENASLLVRGCFATWKGRALDIKAWKDACRRHEAYKEKTTSEKAYSERSFSPSLSCKRRRQSGTHKPDPPRTRRRLKSRLSDGLPTTRTDEELAQRLQENKKENEKRWAKGSFEKTITELLQSRRGDTHRHWRTWLSLNPENDQTAIFLEKKFDVANSGDWQSDSVFAVNHSDQTSEEGYPGLIVFECTPLEGFEDDLERKYRILDDCSRLRDIVSSIPEQRHFVPAVLLLSWGGSVAADAPQDLLNMVKTYQGRGIVGDCKILSLSSTAADIDRQFSDLVQSLELDLDGSLVERVSLSALFERFAEKWMEALFVWVDACNPGYDCDWRLLGHVLDNFFKLLNTLVKVVMTLWVAKSITVSPLPVLNVQNLRDADSIASSVRDWLRSPVLQELPLARHLSGIDFSEELEARAYLTQVCNLVFQHVSRLLSDPSNAHLIAISQLSSSLSRFEEDIQGVHANLKSLMKLLPRVRHRRYSENGDISMTASQTSSPSPQLRSSKLYGMDISDAAMYSNPPSPTPSAAASVADPSASVVTTSMLRALARDVLKTYGNKSPMK